MRIEEIRAVEDIPVIVTDDEGIVTYVNAQFEKELGWSADEALGESVTMVIPENLRDAHNMGFSRFLATEKPTLLEQKISLKTVNKSGEEFDAEHFIIAEKIDGDWQFAASIKRL